MTTRQLRRSGGSLTVTIPAALLQELQLCEGDAVEIVTEGDALRIRPVRKPAVTLQAILDAAPDDADALRAPGWDAMPETANENWRC